MKEIDIRDIIHILKKRAWLIALIAGITLLVGVIYTFYLVTPQYRAFTTLYVGRNVADGIATDAMVYQDLMLGQELVNDYRELATSRQVAELTNEHIGLKDISIQDISDMIDVQSRTNTRIIEISVENESAVNAMNIANTVAEVFTERATVIMDIENIQVIDKAIVPEEPATPNKLLNLAIALLLGLILGVGIVFLIEFLDNKIRTPEDVQQILGLPVLGIILSFDEDGKTGKRIEKKAKGERK